MQVYRGTSALPLDDRLRSALRWWKKFFASSGPRVVHVGAPEVPLRIWTDGAHEDSSPCPTTCGALVLDRAMGVFEWFGVVVLVAIRAS